MECVVWVPSGSWSIGFWGAGGGVLEGGVTALVAFQCDCPLRPLGLCMRRKEEEEETRW